MIDIFIRDELKALECELLELKNRVHQLEKSGEPSERLLIGGAPYVCYRCTKPMPMSFRGSFMYMPHGWLLELGERVRWACSAECVP